MLILINNNYNILYLIYLEQFIIKICMQHTKLNTTDLKKKIINFITRNSYIQYF